MSDGEPLSRALLGQADRAPIGHLGVQGWMHTPETRAVIAALQADGAAVRFVGGCVRDSLLHQPVRDIDIATPTPPDQVLALLERAGIRAIPTGLAHGTVTALPVPGHPYEITTLREDIATDGRHAEVRWSDSWMADAARRDFTMNALSASPDGAVYDYFDGLEHLAHGRVLFVGRASRRIEEDTLRILRFFRFHARYGRGQPDGNALAACQHHAESLRTLSAERVRDELLKTLAVGEPAPTLLQMRGARVLAVVLPEARFFGVLRQVAFLEERGIRMDGISPDPLRRLAALCAGTAAELTGLAERLRLSTADQRRLAALAADAPVPQPGAWRAALVRDGRQISVDRLLLDWARWRDLEGRADAAHTQQVMAGLAALTSQAVPVLPLGGADVLACGIAPGPRVGQVLGAVRDWWLGQDCLPGREAVMAQLTALLEGGHPAGEKNPSF